MNNGRILIVFVYGIKQPAIFFIHERGISFLALPVFHAGRAFLLRPYKPVALNRVC